MPAAPPDATLITVAPTGAESAKADVPTLPTTPDELLATAKACEAAGAARDLLTPTSRHCGPVWSGERR